MTGIQAAEEVRRGAARHLLVQLDASAGSVEEVAHIVAQIRRRWPRTRILLRADSGFARADGLVRDEPGGLRVRVRPQCAARRRDQRRTPAGRGGGVLLIGASSTGKPARRFKDFRYATLDCWSRQRRVVAKAEWTKGEANPRRRVAEKTRQSNPRPTGDPQKTDPIRANRARDALVLTTVTAQLLSGRERPSPSYERCGLACRREY